MSLRLPPISDAALGHLAPEHVPGHHQALGELAARAAQQHTAFLVTGLRTVEVMMLELQHVLLAHPDVVRVSFDQEGGPNAYPCFSCNNAQDEDLSKDYGASDEVALRWLSSGHPAARAFLVEAEGRVFTRDGWPGQFGALALKLGNDHLGMTTELARAWADSLERHFVAQGLEARLPAGASPRPRPRA